MKLRLKCAVVSIGAMVLRLGAQPLDEAGVVAAALSTNTTVQILLVERLIDSLHSQNVASGWLPRLNVSAQAALAPVESTLTATGVERASAWTIAPELEIAQTLPGGATVTLGAQSSSLGYSGVDQNPSSAQKYWLEATQPLLREAWKHAPLEYAVKIQDLASRELSLEQRNTLATTLSEARQNYWNVYAATKKLQITRQSMEYAQRRLQLERARFAIGTVALIDTLSASLQMAQAQQDLFGDSLALLKARNQLALTLMSRPDSLVLVDSVAFELNPLPPAGELLAQVQRYNPTRQIFELTAQRLHLQQERAKNQLLPDVRAKVSIAQNDEIDRWSLYNRSVVSLLFSYALPNRTLRNTVAEAKLQQQKNEFDARLNEQRLAVAVEELVTTWDQERQRLELAKTSQSIANQHFIAAQRGYELGTVDYLRYIEAENSLRDASLELLSQQIGLKRLEITFDEISGNLFARFGVTF